MKLKHLFFLAVTGTLAVACSEVNENSLTDGDGQRMLRTISSGNDRFSTRLNSETSEWESGDAIGIYMFDTEDKNVLNDALNVKYTTIGEGLTVNFSSDPGIAIYDMPTNFVAYYPHATSADVIDATAALYKVDISDQSNGISAVLDNQTGIFCQSGKVQPNFDNYRKGISFKQGRLHCRFSTKFY